MKKGVSAIVATVFLVMISITAIAVVYWTVIPFIKGNLDLDQRKVDLQIITTNGYTLYDKDQGIAYVQIQRGVDNVTLHGMEVMIDFDGVTYKTTLRAPNSGESKSYFFNMQDMKNKNYLPRTVSVAPIFILDAREVLGDITSKVSMPILNIVKEYVDIIKELELENQPVINITEGNTTQSNICNTYVGEDPWGGCPIAMGDIHSVNYDGDTVFDFNSSFLEAVSYYPNYKYLKFKGDNCVINESICASFQSITPGSWSGSGYSYIPLNSGEEALNQTGLTTCEDNNWFYVYDNSDCKK